jgi:hypothetical protein
MAVTLKIQDSRFSGGDTTPQHPKQERLLTVNLYTTVIIHTRLSVEYTYGSIAGFDTSGPKASIPLLIWFLYTSLCYFIIDIIVDL